MKTKILLLSILMLVSTFTFSQIVDESFEQSVIPAPWRLSIPRCKSENACHHEFSTTIKRTGNQSLKSVLVKSYMDTACQRTEIASNGLGGYSQYGKEYWYAVSIYLPGENDTDTWVWERNRQDATTNHDILTQLHFVPKQGESGHPVLAIKIKDERWVVDNHFGTPENASDTNLYIGQAERGVWTDWVIHAKWLNTPEGLIEVWKNQQLVAQYLGPNCYYDQVRGFRNIYMKIGDYKPRFSHNQSNTTYRVVYHDAVKMKDSTSFYEDVSVTCDRQMTEKDLIYTTTPDPQAEEYKFRFANTANGTDVFFETTTANYVNLEGSTKVNWGDTYRIRVKKKINGVWETGYSEQYCQVKTPALSKAFRVSYEPDMTGTSDITVSPIPLTSNSAIKIHGAENESFDYRVISMDGKIVDERTGINASETVLSESIPSGIFILEIYRNGAVRRIKIIK